MNTVSWPAVLICAFSAFLLGGMWYSPQFFGRVWVREAGQSFQPGHPTRAYVTSFLFMLISAFVFDYFLGFLGERPELGDAVRWGATVGAGFVAASFGINYQFAGRSSLLWVIDAGYHLVQFTLYGLIIGLWHA
jgi:hypothetical protein